MANCIDVMRNMLRLYEFAIPSLVDVGKHGKRHAIRTHKPQAVPDWLNPLSARTMSAFGYTEN